MSFATGIYEIELWSRQGLLVADISPLVKDVSFTLQRNTAETLQFSLDLNAFESLALTIGTAPRLMLNPYQTDVKIKRNGEYLFGTQVFDVSVELSENDQTISVKCFGYLKLLSDRYITKTYTSEYETDIVWDMINTTQSQTNGDLGITQGDQWVQLVQRDRTYDRNNIADMIVNLTNLSSNSFDFEFTYDKKINTYTMIGSDRSNELVFVYPDNIMQATIPRTGLKLFNKIYGIGAGFGNDQITSTQSDNDSQLNFGVHETVRTWNSVLQQDTLDDNALGMLNNTKNILEIPQMSVNGRDFDLANYGIGDRVTVRVNDHRFLETINGIYRIEKIDCKLDENQNEDITLYFDNNDKENYSE